jgi:hypothetical protein
LQLGCKGEVVQDDTRDNGYIAEWVWGVSVESLEKNALSMNVDGGIRILGATGSSHSGGGFLVVEKGTRNLGKAKRYR